MLHYFDPAYFDAAYFDTPDTGGPTGLIPRGSVAGVIEPILPTADVIASDRPLVAEVIPPIRPTAEVE